MTKVFIGGFRDRTSGKEYHNAITQTKPKECRPSDDLQCRETQTLQLKNASTQPSREAVTQMTKVGCYVSEAEDKLLTPRVVPTVDEWLAAREKKIILLQSYWRRWLAKRRVNQIRKEKADIEVAKAAVEASLQHDKERVIKNEYRRRLKPRTKSDFDLVYTSIQKWYKQEADRIKSGLDDPEKRAAPSKLHKDHMVLLSAVESQKRKAKKKTDDLQEERLLLKVTSPIGFTSKRNGKLTYMETPWITRSKELVSIYRTLSDNSLTKNERLDLLLTVTVTISEFVCDLTSEISFLVDREVALLSNGAAVNDAMFDGMRQRLRNLFLEFIKNPLFNPQVARFLRVGVTDQGSTDLESTRLCNTCKEYRMLDKMSETCRDCKRIRNISTTREDLGFYAKMLVELRKSENLITRNPDISLFVMTDEDLKHLVAHIWQSSSLVSGRHNVYSLKLVRWDKHRNWSPWNCVLLTAAESLEHLKLPDLKVYSEAVKAKVTLRHQEAKNRFEPVFRKRSRNN